MHLHDAGRSPLLWGAPAASFRRGWARLVAACATAGDAVDGRRRCGYIYIYIYIYRLGVFMYAKKKRTIKLRPAKSKLKAKRKKKTSRKTVR